MKAYYFILILVCAACQRQADIRVEAYQSGISVVVSRYTDTLSGAFTAAGHGARAVAYGSYPSYQVPRYTDSADQCVRAAQAYPRVSARYSKAMVTLGRCLNRLVQEQNYMMTWTYQQMAPQTQRQWNYAMNYPQTVPYSQYSSQYPSAMTDPFGQLGWTGLGDE